MWKSSTPIASAAVIVRKHSPYKKFLKEAIISMIENGQLNAYITRYSKSEEECKTRRSKGDALGMSKLATLFFMLLFGCLISFLICAFEHIFKSPNGKRKFLFHDFAKYENAFSVVRSLIPQMDENLKNDTEWILNKMQDVYRPNKNK